MFPTPSNIRVFVHWAEHTVFAGEDVECRITFKNVATTSDPSRSLHRSNSSGGHTITRERQRHPLGVQPPPLQPRTAVGQAARPLTTGRGHRSALSLNVSIGDDRVNRSPHHGNAIQTDGGPAQRSHRRSVSIVSLGTEERGIGEESRQYGAAEPSRRPPGSHTRSSSLQILPRRSGMNGSGPMSAPFPYRSRTQPSPLLHNFSRAGESVAPEAILSTSGPDAAAGDDPLVEYAAVTSRLGSTGDPWSDSPQNFRFPASDPLHGDHYSPDDQLLENERATSRASHAVKVGVSRVVDTVSKDQFASLKKISSPMSNGGTPRSSGEFYSLSNNSTETLASEYLPPQASRPRQRGLHARKISSMPNVAHSNVPEVLMMGYAQIHGSFTLDGSLVNQNPFEEVKRKGVSGGQGGGVIGIEASKRESGLLRAFGWGNIGESIGGLLGGGELSSIKEMRGIANSKAIPLLSTPHAILFVDLRLLPGQSRSYHYSFKLPKGLPPTHRGRAIKISYNLTIGVQRPGGAKEQNIKTVEIPFRLLGSVNTYGEVLGHDLMAPYILLKDQALVQDHGVSESRKPGPLEKWRLPRAKDSAHSGHDDFQIYIERLLESPRRNSSLGLLSPTELPISRRPSSVAEPASAAEAIDLAILKSNLVTDSHQSANRFEIARNGRRVAVILLARPAYRLGESIMAAIDFTDASTPCYALHASLETSEKVDGALALRSEASIRRVTRKIYDSQSETTLFARRIIFTPTIPPTATPSFITSGLCLEWKIVVEFVTPRFGPEEERHPFQGSALLEETSRDERGAILGAVEAMECESFEIAIPVRVYGAVSGSPDKAGDMEGLVI